MRVVADTGPLHYLVLISAADVLARLFGRVAIPAVVRDELNRPRTPPLVQAWIAVPPPWLAVVTDPLPAASAPLAGLDDGERAAISLAAVQRADLLLMDDRAGVAAARRAGFAVTGTLGLLDRAARRGLLDLPGAFSALRATNFHARPALLDALLAEHHNRSGGE